MLVGLCLHTARSATLSISSPFGQHDAIAVYVLERLALLVPPRVVRLDRLVAMLLHPLDGALPLRFVRYEQHQKIVLGRRFADHVTAMVRKLKMIRCAFASEYHAVETFVVLEGS